MKADLVGYRSLPKAVWDKHGVGPAPKCLAIECKCKKILGMPARPPAPDCEISVPTPRRSVPPAAMLTVSCRPRDCRRAIPLAECRACPLCVASAKERIDGCTTDGELCELDIMCGCAVLADGDALMDSVIHPLTALEFGEGASFNSCSKCGSKTEFICACP